AHEPVEAQHAGAGVVGHRLGQPADHRRAPGGEDLDEVAGAAVELLHQLGVEVDLAAGAGPPFLAGAVDDRFGGLHRPAFTICRCSGQSSSCSKPEPRSTPAEYTWLREQNMISTSSSESLKCCTTQPLVRMGTSRMSHSSQS